MAQVIEHLCSKREALSSIPYCKKKKRREREKKKKNEEEEGQERGREGGSEGGSKEGREEGRKEGRQEGRQEGRKAGREGGREGGRERGREGGRKRKCHFSQPKTFCPEVLAGQNHAAVYLHACILSTLQYTGQPHSTKPSSSEHQQCHS
jgi:hypothetical protein